jgi:hypothetical protein
MHLFTKKNRSNRSFYLSSLNIKYNTQKGLPKDEDSQKTVQNLPLHLGELNRIQR